MEIKNKRDPKNVFSLASRISWIDGSSFEKSSNKKKAINAGSSYSTSSTPVKDGEIDPTDCLTPKKIHQTNFLQTALESLSTDDAEDGDNSFDDDDDDAAEENMEKQDVVDVDENGNINVVHQEVPKQQQEDEFSVSSDLKLLLAISDGDDDFKDWSFTESATNLGGELEDMYYDIDKEEDRVSPKSTTEFDSAFDEECTV